MPFLPIICRKIPKFDHTLCCQGCEETDTHVLQIEMESGIIPTKQNLVISNKTTAHFCPANLRYSPQGYIAIHAKKLYKVFTTALY